MEKKSIFVTASDNTSVKDQSPSVVTELMNRFGITTENLMNMKAARTKPLPKEWWDEIILANTKSVTVSPSEINQKPGQHTLVFRNNMEIEEFERIFNNNMPQTINKYIENKAMDPKNFNRVIVLDMVSNGSNQLLIRF